MRNSYYFLEVNPTSRYDVVWLVHKYGYDIFTMPNSLKTGVEFFDFQKCIHELARYNEIRLYFRFYLSNISVHLNNIYILLDWQKSINIDLPFVRHKTYYKPITYKEEGYMNVDNTARVNPTRGINLCRIIFILIYKKTNI